MTGPARRVTGLARCAALTASLTAALLATQSAPAAAQPWVNDPAGRVAAEIVPLYWLMFWVAVVVLAIVTGAMVYAGIRYRDRPGRQARQFHGHHLLELTWTIVPSIIVVTFSVLSFNRLVIINAVEENVDMTIGVEGRQWQWTYRYPQEDRFRLRDGSYLEGVEELHIPAGKKVKLELTATDVIHDFFVPKLGGKMDAVPGRKTAMWIQSDRPGTYKGQCAEFCGDGHADMLIVVVVHSEQEYASWIAEAKRFAEILRDPATQAGRRAFQELACAGCHTIRGLTAGRFPGAPELTDYAQREGRENIAGVLSPVNQENLERWIRNPQSVKPGTLMPTLGIDDPTVRSIAQFLLVLGRQ